MTSQVTYLIAQERIADLQRTADHLRLAAVAQQRSGRTPGHRLITRLKTEAWPGLHQRPSRPTQTGLGNPSHQQDSGHRASL
jgi:hypothetical protein